jgi:hypothetical protein
MLWKWLLRREQLPVVMTKKLFWRSFMSRRRLTANCWITLWGRRTSAPATTYLVGIGCLEARRSVFLPRRRSEAPAVAECTGHCLPAAHHATEEIIRPTSTLRIRCHPAARRPVTWGKKEPIALEYIRHRHPAAHRPATQEIVGWTAPAATVYIGLRRPAARRPVTQGRRYRTQAAIKYVMLPRLSARHLVPRRKKGGGGIAPATIYRVRHSRPAAHLTATRERRILATRYIRLRHHAACGSEARKSRGRTDCQHLRLCRPAARRQVTLTSLRIKIGIII